MIKTYSMIINELKEYGNPKMKLNRLVHDEKYIKVVKGIYETTLDVSGYLLAGSIYGPSYLSFDFALSYYGMIPEAVYTITSATFKKNKIKEYHTRYGNFLFRDVPAKVFPYGIKIVTEGEYCYQIASREKALCDKLYIMKPVSNIKDMGHLLIDNLRIEIEELQKLNLEEIYLLSGMYNSTNVKYLYKYLRRLTYDCN